MAEILRDLEIHGVDARLDVDQKHEHVALGDCLLHLAAYGTVQGIGGAGDHAARIHQPEAPPVPFRWRKVAVAGHAGLRIDDREAPADDAVEERRLADVGAPDDRDCGDLHAGTSSPTKPSAKSYDSRTGIGSWAARS